ncbi:DUF664 domain-containing protein [Streptomyces sp. NPDC002730]|uniref:mycothiol transferase n=1 Tax=Streptomyces sp. NPDC002730 TaxID=3364662 RepID=UPI003688D458
MRMLPGPTEAPENLWRTPPDLDVTGTNGQEPILLREGLLHMIEEIEEYARQNGHADFLREWIDGRVGQWASGRFGAPDGNQPHHGDRRTVLEHARGTVVVEADRDRRRRPLRAGLPQT